MWHSQEEANTDYSKRKMKKIDLFVFICILLSVEIEHFDGMLWRLRCIPSKKTHTLGEHKG